MHIETVSIKENRAENLRSFRECFGKVLDSYARDKEILQANNVKCEGEKPMNITWELDAPIPAKYLKKTNKLVVGLKHEHK